MIVWIKTGSNGGDTKNSVDDSFKINKNSTKLDTSKLVMFHNIVAKILFFTKYIRPNTCIFILFFTLQVKEPNVNNRHKLDHFMKYIRKL